MRHSLAYMILLVLLAVCGYYGARFYGGEVATLYTTDVTGRGYQNSIWLVDQDGDIWIRAIGPTSPWLDRILNRSEVQLLRAGRLRDYRATPLPHRRERVNALMAEHYGWAEWALSWVEGRDQAIPVYLDPFG